MCTGHLKGYVCQYISTVDECYFISACVFRTSVVLSTPSTVVFLHLNGSVILDHRLLLIYNIGFSDNSALLCITDRPPPTNSTTSGGNWFAPDRTRVGGETPVPGFNRNRGSMVVRLKRNTGTATEGIYYCEVNDNTESNWTVYVGIYNGGGMY